MALAEEVADEDGAGTRASTELEGRLEAAGLWGGRIFAEDVLSLGIDPFHLRLPDVMHTLELGQLGKSLVQVLLDHLGARTAGVWPKKEFGREVREPLLPERGTARRHWTHHGGRDNLAAACPSRAAQFVEYVRSVKFPRAAHVTVFDVGYQLTTSAGNVLSSLKASEARAIILTLPFLLHDRLGTWDERYAGRGGRRLFRFSDSAVDDLAAMAHKGLEIYEIAMDHAPDGTAAERMAKLVEEFEAKVLGCFKDTGKKFLARPKAHDMRHLPEALREIGPLYYASMQAFEREHKGLKRPGHNNHAAYTYQVAAKFHAKVGAELVSDVFGGRSEAVATVGALGAEGPYRGEWSSAAVTSPAWGEWGDEAAAHDAVRFRTLRLQGGDAIQKGTFILFRSGIERVGCVQGIVVGGGRTFVAVAEHEHRHGGPAVFGPGSAIVYSGEPGPVHIVAAEDVLGVQTLFPWRGSYLRSLRVDHICTRASRGNDIRQT